jgi:ATP-dependent Lhr-like helicase
LSLTAYPDYRRVEPDEHGVWRVPDARLARRHRMSVGTIVSDASINVKYWSKGGGGGSLGSVEEGFIARLKPGDGFLFSGRLLELVRVENMTAYVKRSTTKKAAVPRWNGGRMPLSSELADAVVDKFDAAAHGVFDSPEMHTISPLLEVQRQWSALPTQGHAAGRSTEIPRRLAPCFFIPFAGRHVHLGLASLLAWRLSRDTPLTFSIAVNDYGFELLSATPVDWAQRLTADLFSEESTGRHHCQPQCW